MLNWTTLLMSDSRVTNLLKSQELIKPRLVRRLVRGLPASFTLFDRTDKTDSLKGQDRVCCCWYPAFELHIEVSMHNNWSKHTDVAIWSCHNQNCHRSSEWASLAFKNCMAMTDCMHACTIMSPQMPQHTKLLHSSLTACLSKNCTTAFKRWHSIGEWETCAGIQACERHKLARTHFTLESWSLDEP